MATAADWTVLGRLTQASNATLLVEVGGCRRVYKPVAGETPLWDFPAGTLGLREVAVHRISQALGWDVVPHTTWVDDGPFGPGMVQDWVDDSVVPVGLFPPDGVPGGWLPIGRGYDEEDREVVLAHEDSAELVRIAVFDVLVNNADRKGGHLLRTADGHVFGIDHGVCLHEQPKLRTVLWGFAGRRVPHELLTDMAAALPQVLQAAEQLSAGEQAALERRATQLLEVRTFPDPSPRGPAFPWPPL